MKPVESNHVDKSEWLQGPWMDEPDRVEWRSEGTPRLPCLIVRGPRGALCGYVGVPEGHPYYGKNGVQAYRLDLDCHGGITYGEPCAEDGHICHVPQPGEPDTVHWLGFDHSGDLSPAHEKHHRRIGLSSVGYESYKTIDYVRREVEQLAVQLQRVAKGLPAREDE